MKVLLVSAGEPGSDYYRIREPARAVQEADAGITVTVAPGIATTMVPSSSGEDRVVGEVDAQGADVVVLQLPKTVEMLQVVRLLQARGIAVVVEMDDLLSAVPFGHPAHQALVRTGMSRIALECTRTADLVTAPTPALLTEYAKHGRGAVIPNAVPRRTAELPPAYERRPDTVTIGWTGNVGVHPYDLQEMGSGLQQALGETRGRTRFAILGQAWDARELLRLPEDPVEIPWIHGVDRYVAALGEQFDVGVAPLRIDRFNTCKSWLKPLEYAARGVYCVRARTDEYERLGLGRPARAPRDWARGILAGALDADLRAEQGAANRQKVLAGHLTEHTAERWVTAWRTARDNRVRAQRRGA